MKRIRAFETRYVSQSNTSPSSRSWAFLNSAFFLWLLSTVLIGLATFIYSQHQTCEVNFQENNDRFVRLLSEYQFRLLKFKEAFLTAKSDTERAASAKWMYQPPSFIHADYKTHTFADINMDLIRTFAELSIYSDMLDFNFDEKGLSVSYRGQDTRSTAKPALDVSATSTTSPLSLLGGPTLVALHTAVLVRAHPDCGLQAIARRSIFPSGQRYTEQAQKAYERLSSVEVDKIFNDMLNQIMQSVTALSKSNTQNDPTMMMKMMMMMMMDRTSKQQESNPSK